MAIVRVRKDIWELGDEANPWRDRAILAYARAVAAMQLLDQTQPANGTSWRNQAAIHERRAGEPVVRGRLENQCQHAGWYFLPWHRMYLHWFEEIVRATMPAADAETWALPYWNYSAAAARRSLPPAFRAPTLPDGAPNPLRIAQRALVPVDVNAGQPLSSAAAGTTAALAPRVFTRSANGATPGFGGSRTGFHHGTQGGGAGPLEGTPHGTVHVAVGGFQNGAPGFMSSFGTAALDPIFWLHHCNLDRLWEQWRRGPSGGHPAGSNPTDSAWLQRRFDFVRPGNTRVRTAVSEVLDIEGQLGYTYSGLPAAPAPTRDVAGRPQDMTDKHPPEMVGASDEGLTLQGSTRSTRLPVSAASGPARREAAAGPPRTYLNIENIEGDTNPGLLYGVFVNLPEGEPADADSPHLAGTVSFFGIESTVPDGDDDEAPHALRYSFDITPLMQSLEQQGDWDPERLDVTFSPLGASDEELSDRETPPVQIGRISLFVE